MAESDRKSWIDKAILDAQERGLFDGLEGEGKPINWEDESLIDDEWLMAFRIMREHGFAPEWIELHKEINQQLAAARDAVLRAWRWRQERLLGASETERHYIDNEWSRARAVFDEAINELNARITDFNLIVPLARLQKFKLDPEEELADLGIDT